MDRKEDDGGQRNICPTTVTTDGSLQRFPTLYATRKQMMMKSKTLRNRKQSSLSPSLPNPLLPLLAILHVVLKDLGQR